LFRRPDVTVDDAHFVGVVERLGGLNAQVRHRAEEGAGVDRDDIEARSSF
jgi:hypothetical protein